MEEDQALLLEREERWQVPPTGTFKLTTQHTSLAGERAGLHTLHLQVTPCPFPVGPRGQSRRPNSSTYREVCEGYTCGGKGTVIRPPGFPCPCGPRKGPSQWLGEGLVITPPLW